MFRRLIQSLRSDASKSAVRQFVEQMEPRQLMAATVTNVIADNRGEVTITLSQTVTGVDKSSVRMTTSGPDSVPGTADDVRVPGSVRLSGTRITLRAAEGAVESNASYIVRLDAKLIKTADGSGGLDGEFTGTFPTGNGSSGGNFVFRTVRDRGDRPRARMSTSLGVINLSLFKPEATGNVANFLDYANSGRYDNFFWSRAEQGFVVQAGGVRISDSNTVEELPAFATVTGEPGVSNTRGRISLALSGSPDSGSSEFFINLANNTFLDDTSTGSGPFTAFGEIADTNSLAVADAIGNSETVNFSTLTPPISTPGTLTSKVPVNDASVAQAGLDPARDLIVIRRTAARMKLAVV